MRKWIWITTLYSLGSTAALAQDLKPANVSTYIGSSQWKWTIYLTGSKELLGTVNYVEYTLHPTFPNPVQKVDRTADTRYPFGFTATGWGVFAVGIKVVFKDGQVRNLTHMLQFVAASSQSTCGQVFTLMSRRPQVLTDPRFQDPVYLYVDEIHAEWARNPPNLTMFYGSGGRVSAHQFTAPSKFAGDIKSVSPGTKWSLKIRHEGDAIQFRYGASYYLLTVMKVNVRQGENNSLDMQVCEKVTAPTP